MAATLLEIVIIAFIKMLLNHFSLAVLFYNRFNYVLILQRTVVLYVLGFFKLQNNAIWLPMQMSKMNKK